MSDLRHDPLTKRWVIIAPERGDRPGGDHSRTEEKKTPFCPFCPGNEDKTPSEIFALRSSGQPNSGNWSIRVVPNRYPALGIEGKVNRRAEGLYDKMRGVGAHEVIIEGPQHLQHFHQMSVEQTFLVLNTVRQRMIDLERDKRFRHLLLFKNIGQEAGASLEHPHLQLNAFPFTPFEVALELQSSRSYYHEKERCLLCDIADYESKISSHIIVESLYFLAFCPYASRFPFEIMIAPKPDFHKAYFTEIEDLLLQDLAQVIQMVLRKLELALNNPPFNLVLHMAPFFRSRGGETVGEDFHWHLHILPRTTKIAGLELGAEVFVNPVWPETAAKNLREVVIKL